MDYEDLEKLAGLGKGAFNHVPKYARNDAIQSVLKVRELEDSQLLRPGLYYVALIDMCGSTNASSVLGMETNKERIEEFIRYAIQALQNIQLTNQAQFIKDIGDAALLLFSAFQDIIKWSAAVDELHRVYNSACEAEGKPDVFRMESKKVIHTGEIIFSDKTNPVSHAVNQVFKIEKEFKAGEIGCTDAVRRIIQPMISSGELGAEEVNRITLPGEEETSPIWRITAITAPLHKEHA
jgi:class 3 adenylate cyclase